MPKGLLKQPWLKNYLHRVYPLQSALLWAKTLRPQPKASRKLDAFPFDPEHSAQQLQTMFSAFDQASEMTSEASGEPPGSRALFETMGFWLERRVSKISGAGTIYHPGEPIFLMSLRNSYILRCYDGVFLDGKSIGLSRHIYNSLYLRDNYPGTIETSDRSWMSAQSKNPLAVGQIVNNGTKDFPANVGYQELDLSPAFPLGLQRFLPNVYNTDRDADGPIRVVVLVAMREVRDEELFSTYFEIVE
ncbi:hypothetical protein BC938DRAFT_474150 [Jimgerdemannia flammicorona]|uniref:SET domain-containing protein n=1 Tax=Jimgerdemannia flammicorona TaxID=994334 RepID=A0A433Q2Q9_9FUNG|nr:hypothetical protein BC938DRAFT_474150 [Jimgerdemannia flammicorona]